MPSPMSRRCLLPAGVAVLGLSAALPGRASAQACDTVSSATTLAGFSGRTIRRVRIVTADPAPFPGPAALLTSLHVRTRASTVARELLVAAGDTVDTLRVAESLRRLRRLHFLAAPEVRAADCGAAAGPVELTVVTQDLWSTKPSVQVRSATTLVGLTERNLLGTGREAQLALRSERGRVGFGAVLRDPALLGGPVAADLGMNVYRDGSEWLASIGRRERSVRDDWAYGVSAGQSTRATVPPIAASGAPGRGESFRRTDLAALVGRRLGGGGAGGAGTVWRLQGGVEYERAALAAAPGLLRLGPAEVRRQLAAVDVGLLRRSVAYDTLTWLLPGAAIVDVPLAFELDALAGVGRESVGGAPIVHLDAWAGRMWRPGPRSLLVADVWASGYRTPARWTAGTLRAGLADHVAASRGLWSARLGGEWLFDPDPDLRAMVAADPTAGALPRDGRLAEAALAASLERDVRLRPISRSWALDGAAFAAASTRWDPVGGPSRGAPTVGGEGEPEGGRLSVGVVGVGLRLAPTRLGRSTARLDVGYPVVRTSGVPVRPYVAIGITPWLQEGRHRDGRGGR